MSPPGPGLLWGFDLSASIRNCMAAYASSACFAHESHRGAIWLHVAFSSPRLEHALRSHSAAWHRNSSDGFTAVPRRRSPGPEGQVQDSFAVPAFIKKNALRRSNEATGGS